MPTNTTPETRTSWPAWAEFFHRRGLENFAAWALEAAGPLTVLGAQALYIAGPLLNPVVSNKQIEAFAHLLEDSHEARTFAAFLREEGTL
jgi:hypothetical protein